MPTCSSAAALIATAAPPRSAAAAPMARPLTLLSTPDASSRAVRRSPSSVVAATTQLRRSPRGHEHQVAHLRGGVLRIRLVEPERLRVALETRPQDQESVGLLEHAAGKGQ